MIHKVQVKNILQHTPAKRQRKFDLHRSDFGNFLLRKYYFEPPNLRQTLSFRPSPTKSRLARPIPPHMRDAENFFYFLLANRQKKSVYVSHNPRRLTMLKNQLPQNILSAVEIIVEAIRRDKSKLLDYSRLKSEHLDVAGQSPDLYAGIGPAQGAEKWTKDIFKRGRR